MAKTYHVRMTETKEFDIRADDEEQLMDWMNHTSFRDISYLESEYDDEILGFASNEWDYSISITKGTNND